MSHKKKRKKALAALNPDEAAFVHALVAGPDDATARLVFADWLDEHDDPRAAWLRDNALWSHLDADAVAWLLVPGTDTRLPRAIEAAGAAAVPFVRAWVRHRDTLNRWYQARFFIESNRPAELRPVNELGARLESENWYDRWEVALDLGFHGPAAAEAVPALVSALDKQCLDQFSGASEDPLKRVVFGALTNIGPAALAAVRGVIAEACRSEAAYSTLLALAPDPDLVYEHLVCDSDESARIGVCLVADLSADPVAALVRILREMNGVRSEAAAELLGEMGDAAATAVPAMVEVFELAHQHWHGAYLRYLLAEAFAAIGEPARIAIPALRAVLPQYERLEMGSGYGGTRARRSRKH